MKALSFFVVVAGSAAFATTHANAAGSGSRLEKAQQQGGSRSYSGKTADWPRGYTGYFYPSGKYIYVNKDHKSYGEARWKVSGNRMCYHLHWQS